MTDQQGAPRASVLIVDDDPDICEVLTDLLRHEGYDAEHAWSGTEALAKIQKAAFGAVILNVHLPDQDGRVVLLELRERYPTLPVIMLADDMSVRQQMLNSGAFAFVVKPYTKTELLEILRRAIQRA